MNRRVEIGEYTVEPDPVHLGAYRVTAGVDARFADDPGYKIYPSGTVPIQADDEHPEDKVTIFAGQDARQRAISYARALSTRYAP